MTGDQGAQVCGVLTTYYLLVDLNVALRWSGHHLSCVREPMRRSHNRLCVCVCVAATVLPCRPAPPMILEGCVVVLLGYVIDLARRTPPPVLVSLTCCAPSPPAPPPPPPLFLLLLLLHAAEAHLDAGCGLYGIVLLLARQQRTLLCTHACLVGQLLVKVLKEIYIKGERDLVYRQKRPILIGIPAPL